MNIPGSQIEDGVKVLSASAAKTTTFTTNADDGYKNADSIILQANVTAQSGTTPTLDIKLQDSFDSGSTWQDTGIAIPTITTTTGTFQVRSTLPLAPLVRAVCTIGGTTPSYTFALTIYAKAKKQYAS